MNAKRRNSRHRNLLVNLALVVGFVLLVLSCKTYKVFNINIWEPAEIIVPQSIQRVLVAHNAPDTASNRNILYTIYSQQFFDTVYYDTAIGRSAVENLAGMLNFNSRFEAKSIDSLGVLFPENSDEFTVRHVEKIEEICLENEADALILLSSFDKNVEYEIFASYLGGYFSIYTIFLSNRWLFINPFNSKLVDQKVTRDTLSYQIYGYWGTKEEELYMTGRELMMIAAEEAAVKFGARITPHIVETPRIIFKSGDKNIRRGYKQAESGNWMEAAVLWRKTLSKSDPVIRARGSFNLALASEMEGLLDPALTWAEESFSIFPDSLNLKYKTILRERIEQQDDLILQFNQE